MSQIDDFNRPNQPTWAVSSHLGYTHHHHLLLLLLSRKRWYLSYYPMEGRRL